MKPQQIKRIVQSLLLINGISACAGGLLLILDPSGAMLGMSPHQLLFLPFQSYLIPGIALLLINGLSSLLITFLIKRKNRYATMLIPLQGLVTLLWIIVQAMSFPESTLQYIFGTIAVLLILLGLMLHAFRHASVLD